MNKLAESFFSELDKLGFVFRAATKVQAPTNKKISMGKRPTSGSIKSQAAGATPVNVSDTGQATSTLPKASVAPSN